MKEYLRLLYPVLFAAILLVVPTPCIAEEGSIPTGNDGGENGEEGELDEAEDPFNQINIIVLEEGKVIKREVGEISEGAFTSEPFEDKQRQDSLRVPPVNKIHPYLRQLLDEQSGDERIRVVINFRDDLRIPRFPQPFTEQERNSQANRQARDRAQELIEEIRQRRTAAYDALTTELIRDFEGEVIQTFWLIKGMTVEIPLRSVQALLERDDVVYIGPDDADETPPQNANNDDDVVDGRARIGSDPYFDLSQTNGYIGLLDTGVRFTHDVFNSPSNIGFRFDCTDGICDDNPDVNDCCDHGTRTASIITGNNRLGNAFRGVTGITLDSFKVYPSNRGRLNYTATIEAFQRAVAILDRVIVAEMQSGENDTGSISEAADKAYDSGAVIIAANGNNGSSGARSVNAPAIAHKVIGVGNFDVQTQNQIGSQSRGPAPDNRIKPDIQAPTNTETASSASDNALAIYGETSGATPYAAGAAALFRNLLRGNRGGIDPGQVYAQLILAGSQPFPFNNTTGAGPIRMPVNGEGWWGKVSVRNGETINIPIDLPGGTHDVFDGALWWPETAAQDHNDIDLQLVDPSGNTREESVSVPSVLERARVTGSIQPGVWTVRIRGFNVCTGRQTVYWTAFNTR